jgi:drug/metabolite transporter (DMT)-like permease
LLRVAGGGLLFWLLRMAWPQTVALHDMKRLFLCGLFGVAVNQMMFFEGLMRTSPVNSSIIMVATPILVLVMSGLLIGERITWGKIFGVVLGAAGALSLILTGSSENAVPTSRLGDLFILINASSYAIFLVLVKPLMQRYSAITVMSWSFLFGLVLVIPFGAAGLPEVDWTGMEARHMAGLVFVVVIVTFVAYLLNTWALRVVEPSLVGMYIYLQPLLAVIFTWLYMTDAKDAGSVLGWPQAGSAAAIFLGVHLVGRRSNRQ